MGKLNYEKANKNSRIRKVGVNKVIGNRYKIRGKKIKKESEYAKVYRLWKKSLEKLK